MKISMLFPWILMVSVVSACSPILPVASTNTPSSSPIPTQSTTLTQSPISWEIIFSISGGLRGLNREVYFNPRW